MSMNPNLNYRLFQLADATKGKLLCSIPSGIIPRRINIANYLQIAITTYVDRYDQFFKPLYKSLNRLFPEVNIFVAANGFHDRDVQSQYLCRIHNELCNRDLCGNTFILHDKPVGLTRLWNELISQGNCKTTLILNDDLRVYPWFRAWIEKKYWESNITLINGTWSHFFFSKDILETVGWFDESFQGIGFEDMDYTARCSSKGITMHNVRCQYIQHLDHQPLRTSFDNKSSTYWGPKYSTINHDSFFRKWAICDHNSGIFIKQLNSFVIPKSKHKEKHSRVELFFKNGVYYPDRK